MKLVLIDPLSFVCPCDEDYYPCQCRKRPFDRQMLLECQNQNLRTLPKKIAHLPHDWMWQLNFSWNRFELEQLMEQIPPESVAILDLSCNNLNSSIFNFSWWSSSLSSSEFHFPRLTHMDLSHNRLSSMPRKFIGVLNRTRDNLKFTLGNNPWNCVDCENVGLLDLVTGLQEKISDWHQITCANGIHLTRLGHNNFCPSFETLYVSITFIVAGLLTLMTIIFIVCLAKNKTIRVWLYNHDICLPCVAQKEGDDYDELPYDAFVSYSHKDEHFVTDHLVPRLEQPTDGSPPFRLCLHYRDWLGGEWIPDQISRSVSTSKRTIVVLSEHFLGSMWAQLEFRTAYQQVLKDQKMRLIVIVIGDVPSKNDMGCDLSR